MSVRGFFAGAAVAVAGRALLLQLLLVKFARDVKHLNSGDHSTLLKAYADDAVLRFHDGDHRWGGVWVGKPNVDRFPQNFTAAKLRGEVGQLAIAGPPWALTIMVRFDDRADGPDGTRLYENRTVLVIRTRWGKIVDHEDFYADTGRLLDFRAQADPAGSRPGAEARAVSSGGEGPMADAQPRAGDPGQSDATLGWLLLGGILLLLIQASLGMIVNLYVAVPADHPGAHPANYFVGSVHSMAWAIAHSPIALAVHATLGLLLVVVAIGIAVHAVRSRRRAVAGWSILAGLLAIGAGFNGASFLDFAHNLSSLIMALLSFAAIACYCASLLVLGRQHLADQSRQSTGSAA